MLALDSVNLFCYAAAMDKIDAIREWMDTHNWTTVRMAGELGVTPQYVSYILNRRKPLTQGMEVRFDALMQQYAAGQVTLTLTPEQDAKLRALASLDGKTPVAKALEMLGTILSMYPPPDGSTKG